MTRPAAPTQMIILPIQETLLIDQPSTQEGQVWSQILGILEKFTGFQRLDWGRHVEEPGQGHLHIGEKRPRV